jgi:hypothetical protein
MLRADSTKLYIGNFIVRAFYTKTRNHKPTVLKSTACELQQCCPTHLQFYILRFIGRHYAAVGKATRYRRRRPLLLLRQRAAGGGHGA